MDETSLPGGDGDLQRAASAASNHLDLAADLTAVLSASSYPIPAQLRHNSSASPSSYIQLSPLSSHDEFASRRDTQNTLGVFGFELESPGKINHEPVRVESPTRAKDKPRKKITRTRRRSCNVDGEDPKMVRCFVSFINDEQQLM